MWEKYFHDFDWLILLSTILLIVMGCLTLYSIGHIPEEFRDAFQGEQSNYLSRQLIWVLAGLVVMAVACLVPFRYYEGLAVVFYGIALLLLVVVLFAPAVKGAHRWIDIGGFSLQPSEFMKIAIIFLLARFLSEKQNRPAGFRVLSLGAAIAVVPFLLVMKEPDLGTALVYLALLFPILYWRGIDEGLLMLAITPILSALLTIYSATAMEGGGYPYLLLLYFIVILIAAYRRRRDLVRSIALVGMNLGVMLIVPMVWKSLESYQQKRILTFLRPESDILGSGWQVYQSKLAIGSGGFMGKKFLHGTHKLLAFLPERHSDFIYSVISEELGFLGALAVLVLYSIIIVRGLYLAAKLKNRFASLACIGICAYFAFHVVVNIGMTTGITPVTGLPLPFLS
ncbi:MAG: rod shape-determining protein RodA, partial [Candidatus Krumholzibacteria bacterium]|nr:rod shape-determining protein RodA [Candidatus Krumholzibacteria bacterium]